MFGHTRNEVKSHVGLVPIAMMAHWAALRGSHDAALTSLVPYVAAILGAYAFGMANYWHQYCNL